MQSKCGATSGGRVYQPRTQSHLLIGGSCNGLFPLAVTGFSRVSFSLLHAVS